MKRLISALHLRFAYVIMAARTEEAITSPKCSSIAVTSQMPSQFEAFRERWGTKTTSIPGILFARLMRRTLSSTSRGPCDLGNYRRTRPPPPSSLAVRSYLKAFWLNSLSFRPLPMETSSPKIWSSCSSRNKAEPLRTPPRSNKCKKTDFPQALPSVADVVIFYFYFFI